MGTWGQVVDDGVEGLLTLVGVVLEGNTLIF